MHTLGVVLFVLPFPLVGGLVAGLFIARAGRQGLAFMMVGYGATAKQKEAARRLALDHQQRLGALCRKALRFWPLALLSIGVGIWLSVAY